MQSLAKHQSVCDHCAKVLSEDYSCAPGSRDQLQIGLRIKDENSDCSYHRTHHFCNEACLASHLADRAKGKGKKVAKASMLFADASVTVDITAAEGYKKPSSE